MFSPCADHPLCVRPTRILNQLYGMGLEENDFKMPHLQTPHCGYHRTWAPAFSAKETGSTISYNKGDFLANVDVQQFQPTDITVSVNENVVKVECKHEEKQDEHGLIYRHFIRRYVVPSTGYKMDSIKCSLSTDGVLTIWVSSDAKKDDRVIPIQITGVPSKPCMKDIKTQTTEANSKDISLVTSEE